MTTVVSTCKAIAKATKSKFTLTSAQQKKYVVALISAKNTKGTTKYLTASLGPIQALTPSAPKSDGLAKIAGTAAKGKSLSASAGKWLSTLKITYSYQWYACTKKVTKGAVVTKVVSTCKPIAKATKSKFTLTSAQQKKYIVALISAKNSKGTTKFLTSSLGPVK